MAYIEGLKNMKIIHFVSGIKSGGVEQFLYNYSFRINKKFDIDEYIIYQHNANDKSLNKLKRAGNTCIRIASKTNNPIKNLMDTYRIISKLKPDIVHAHMNLVNFIPLFAAFILKVPVRISHSHIATDNIKCKFLIPFFKRLNIYFSNVLFSCGDSAGKYMYGKRKFTIIRNAIDLNQFKFNIDNRNKCRGKYHINSRTVVFGNIGRLTKQKNQLFLLHIFNEFQKKHPDSILFIVGTGELKKTIDNKINNLKLSNKVYVVSPIDNTGPFYSMIDMFILPSLYEGLPVTSIEAQVSELPLLISSGIDKNVKLLKTTKILDLDNSYLWEKSMSAANPARDRTFTEFEHFKKYDINLCYEDLYGIYHKLVKNLKDHDE